MVREPESVNRPLLEMAVRRKLPGGEAAWLAALLLMVFLAALARPAPAAGLRKVRVRLQCIHQAQFAGLYMAKDLGLYRQKGLSVELLPGNGRMDPLEELSLGRCDFAVSVLAGALVHRSQGVKLVHLAQIIQKPAMMLVVFRNSGIDSVKSMEGRRVSLWSSHLSWAPRALLIKEKVAFREVWQGPSMEPFLRRAVDAACATYFNEYHKLFQAGINFDQIKVFRPSEYGLDFPEDGLYAMQSTWESDPGLCRDFVAASLEGWRRAFAEPEKALGAVMRRVDASHLANNITHQSWMLYSIRELVKGGDNPRPMGELSVKALAKASEELVGLKVMHRRVEADELVRPAWK